MKDNELAIDLIKSIDNTLIILDEIFSNYTEFKKERFEPWGKNKFSGIILSKIFVDFYTCLETTFLRISQFFENSLQSERWHTDLLQKMTQEFEGKRIQVISEKVSDILLEFLRFRHFTRYYFRYDYDWDRLEFLEKKFNQVRPMVINKLNNFRDFLNQLISK